MLNSKQRIVVPELCKLFNVSPATIRNDLNDLQKASLLKRTHGGAILNKQVSQENAFVLDVEHLIEKQALAKSAIELINDGDTIVIDTGTTTFELAKLLNTKKHLTIVLNDIKIALHLEHTCSDANIVLVGGYMRKGLHCTVGPLADISLKGIKVDKAFIATNGITAEGLSTPDMYQADVKRMMIQIASDVIVLADSSKCGHSAFQLFATLNDINSLITDSNVDKEEITKYQDYGVNVTVVNVN